MERPILFSTPMVQAILDVRKSQTRRAMKPQPIKDEEWHGGWKYETKKETTAVDSIPAYLTTEGICPYGKVGDILWVRETWNYLLDENLDQDGFCYKASPETFEGLEPFDGPKWKPSIFMPKEACRIRLEITNIRVERLQDISEEDAVAEGISLPNYAEQAIKDVCYPEPSSIYADLWESINGKDSWQSNPWVWVIDFKKL